jgi:hypothetical protein
MTWTFIQSLETTHAPPPANKVSLLFVFENDEGIEKSLLSYLNVNYSQEEVDVEITRLTISLDEGSL